MSEAPTSVRLSGRAPVTVITGGSRGIGRALAFEFARDGNDLFLIARDEATLARTAEEIGHATGRRVSTLALDLASPDATDRIEAGLAERNLYCQHLVNNAGIGLAGAFTDHDEARLMQLVDVNIRCLTQLTRRFLPAMLSHRDGGVLNVGSLGGFVAGPYQAAYYASKAYVMSFTQALKWECWGSGVRICALAPGPVRTEFHQRMGARRAHYIRVGAGIDAGRVARMGHSGYKCGKGLIIPGYVGPFNAVALKLLPHDLLLPVIGWFLKARSDERKDA